jgi:hypothetical protein
MSDSDKRVIGLPTWVVAGVLTLLALQVGLLWMQGSMLERQHGDFLALRQDVQDLSESLEQFEDNFDQGAPEGTLRPSSHRFRHRRPSVVRVRLQEEGADAANARKDLEATRKSAQEAVEKARDTRSKLSLEENARKAEEKAKLDAEAHKWRPFIWIGVVVALGALFLRSWLRNRN